jgi:hypothetical protein
MRPVGTRGSSNWWPLYRVKGLGLQPLAIPPSPCSTSDVPVHLPGIRPGRAIDWPRVGQS